MPRVFRLNLRMLIFLAVLLAPVGLFFWLFMDTIWSGGIWEMTDERGAFKKVDLKAMSSFEMDQLDAVDKDVPEKFRALDGQKVLLIGEMYDNQKADKRTCDFDLVYSISKCCVRGRPKVQHFVKAKLMPGRTANWFNGLVEVFGTLHVGVQKAEGQVNSVYRIDVESVKQRR